MKKGSKEDESDDESEAGSESGYDGDEEEREDSDDEDSGSNYNVDDSDNNNYVSILVISVCWLIFILLLKWSVVNNHRMDDNASPRKRRRIRCFYVVDSGCETSKEVSN
ncbi:4156_t:CDS:2 [Entrophospora sp. SA101]|nr:4156_t:CDS:2 [Entrophospora sp. SA101]